MNTKNLLIASLVGAVLILIFTNVPILDFINCLLCAGFWGSALFAVWLYRRLNGTLSVKDGVMVGLLAGVFAGVIGFLLSFLGWTGAAELMRVVGQFAPPEAMPNLEALAPAVNAGVSFVGALITIILATIGGWIGGAIFKFPKEPAAQ